MAQFSFGVKKKPVKKGRPQKPPITESQLTEDNPDITKLIEANNEAEKTRLANEVIKQKLRIDDHRQIHTYLCLVFQSETQKFEFLAHFPNVLCVDEVFIDGETFAEAVNKSVTLNELPPIESPLTKKLVNLAKIPL